MVNGAGCELIMVLTVPVVLMATPENLYQVKKPAILAALAKGWPRGLGTHLY